MAVLAIYEPDLRASAQLTSALANAHELISCPTWKAVRSAVDRGDVEVCLAPWSPTDRDGDAERIREVRDLRPDVGLVACVEVDAVDDLFDLGALGVDGVVDPKSRPARIRADVEAALSAVRARAVQRVLARRLPASALDAFAWAAEHAGDEADVERFAAALGHTAGSLRETLQEAGLPAPSRLLLWGRLIQAGARLDLDGRTVEDVAFSLGYATATSLARAMRLHTDLTPAEVARGGGMTAVLDALVPPQEDVSGSGGSLGFRSARQRIGALLTISLTAGCAMLGGSGVDGSAIRGVLEAEPIDQLHVGVHAIDLSSGRTLFSHNAHRKFIPASNQKILVTATAISLFGPDHRFETPVWATGETVGSFVNGDLVVVGSGDPTFSDRYWPSGTAALEAMADSLHARGIRHVGGSLVVDVSAWDSASVGPTWEVEDLRYRYGSTGGAFAIDEGELELVVAGGPSPDAPVDVVWTPVGTSDFVRSRLRTTPADSSTRVRPDYLPESRLMVLEGSVAVDAVDTVVIAVRDPVRQSAAALARALDIAGIEVEGGVRVHWTTDGVDEESCTHDNGVRCARSTRLFAMRSPPMSEIAAGILEPSQNWMTEQTVRALGARFGDEGSWDEGIDVVESFLINEVGVRPTDISARDGSGLSFYNLVTPRAVVRILTEMHQMPWAAAYRAAMAEPGEEDSTLENRLAGLEGRVFAKTGTISNVNSLSGYLVRDNGQEIAFSILSNGSGLPASEVRRAIDEIVRALAR